MTAVAALRGAAGAPARREPWLGLHSYYEADADVFYGRETESLDLQRLVQRETLTVVFGASGTGKTSLLNAGLFPRLRASQCLPVYVRLDHAGVQGTHAGRILDALAAALAQHRIDAESVAPRLDPDRPETLWEYLHRTVLWDPRNHPITPVLVFDQFEEIFTLGRHMPQSDAFLVELADLVENYIPQPVRARVETSGKPLAFPHNEQRYRVVLSLREDFVSRLDDLRRAMPSVMHNRYALTRMTGDQALLAVVNPGRDIVDADVAERIVRFVAGTRAGASDASGATPLKELSVEPALLSVVCRELNIRRIREAKERITTDLVDAARGDILDDFYERAFQGLDGRARVFVEDRLLTSGGFRSTAPVEEAVDAGLTRDVINALIDRRLLRSEERLHIPHLELTHDVLTGVVQRSRSERHLREQREREERQRVEQEAVRIRQQRELRRTRAFLAIVSVALVASVILAFIAYRSSVAARRTREALTEQVEATNRALEDLTLAQEHLIRARDEKVSEMVAASWKSAVYFSEWDRGQFGSSWIYGARAFYNKLKPIMSLEAITSLAPVPVFVSGPHGSEFNLRASDFGRYNPAFLAWAQERAIPAASNEPLRVFTQPMYDRYLRDLARGYYDTYQYLQAQPTLLARVVKGYTAAVDKDRAQGPVSSGNPSAYLRNEFDAYARSAGPRGWFSRPAQPGTNLNFYIASVAAGFWVRRTIDGTAPQFYQLLERLLKTYDARWLRETPAR